jgi:hypothetical protein
MTPTLGEIKAKQSELAKMIAQFEEQKRTYIKIDECTIVLEPGEHYAGAVLDEDGQHKHYLILLAARPDKKLNWGAAMDWADTVGGVLPDRQEQALLFTNCKPHLDPAWHWSCEEHDEDASYAWYCTFDDGSQGNDRKSYEGSAVAVRLIPLTA